MSKMQLKTIYEPETVDILKKINKYDSIVSGNETCKFTDTIITLDNFYAVFEESGSIKFVCDTPDAIKEFTSYIKDRK